MIRYNAKILYNNKQNYNSSTDFIVVISDGAKSNIVVLVDSSISVKDLGLVVDSADISSTVFISDQGVAEDSMSYKSVANYNSKKSYNRRWDNGGASYNSYKHHIVMVEDSGAGTDALDILFDDIILSDNAMGEEVVHISPMVLNLNDIGLTKDTISLISDIYTTDSGAGTDALDMLLELPASEYFIVTANNILEPLGVKVTGDSRHELLPSTRDNTEEIPGMHGEIDFGTEFKARMLELSVVTNEGYAPLEKSQLQRLFAMYLNPTKGPKKLIFGDDIEKTYIVKYSGKIDPTNHPTWFRFVIPFKMSNPFIHGTLEKTLIGSGTLINDGTFETGLIVEINGPATNPSLTIGGQVLAYGGNVPSGQKLIVDTAKGTAKIGNSNAMANYNGVFPLLYPGKTSVTSSSSTTIKWRDKWI